MDIDINLGISQGYNVPDRMINQTRGQGQLHLDKFLIRFPI